MFAVIQSGERKMAATHQLKVIRPTSKNAQVRRVKQGTPATHPLTVDSKGRLIPKLYSKLQANAELRKILNISAKEAPRDITQLSDAELN